MSIEKALSKFSEYFRLSDIENVVQMGESFVFSMFDNMQPVIVNTDEIRGLNGNRKTDRQIIDKMSDIISKEE